MSTNNSGRTKQVAQDFPNVTENSNTSAQNFYGNTGSEENPKYAISFEGSEGEDPQMLDQKSGSGNTNEVLLNVAQTKEQKNIYGKIAGLRASEEEINITLAKSASAVIPANKVPPGWERTKTSPKGGVGGVTTPKKWGAQPVPGKFGDISNSGDKEGKKKVDMGASFESSKTVADENGLFDTLLLKGNKESITFCENVEKQIDKFISRLNEKKDWSLLRTILREKFLSMKGITPTKVKLYLRKLKRHVHGIDTVATNLMENKIDIFFVEKPLRSTVEEIASSEAAVMNFLRDIAWAPLTYLSCDIFLSPADSTWATQTITQTVISMIVMAIGAAIYHLVKNAVVKKDPNEEPEPRIITFVKVLFIWLGAGLAIPPWNALQVVGDNIGLNNLGLSTMGAGYFSTLFPGIPEGPTQGIFSLISMYTLTRTWHKFKLKTFLEQLVIFATFGAVPGDIWQLAYQILTGPIDANDLPNWAITVILGLGLGIAVYIGNVAFGTGYERIINKSHLIIEFEAIEDNLSIESFIDEDNKNLVSYNGRPGAPGHGSILIIKPDHHFSRHNSQEIFSDQFGHHHDANQKHHHGEHHAQQDHGYTI